MSKMKAIDARTNEYCSVGADKVLTATLRLATDADKVSFNGTGLGANITVSIWDSCVCAFFYVNVVA